MANEQVIVEVGAEDNATDKLEKVADKTEELGGSMASNFGKATSASKTFALALAGVGAAAAAGFVVAVNAARGAQEQMARVDAILKTLGKTGDEARGAIEAHSAAMVKLGFDDEDAAESMARLVQRTKDVTQSQKLAALAADLARAKNIELGAATDLVGQVLSGNGKVLKQYGIDINEAASPMEALAQLQGQVAGQAEAYSQTLNGALATLQVTFGNFLEEVGTPFLGFLTQVIQGFLSWIDSMGGVTGILNTLKAAFTAIQPFLPIIAGMVAGALVPAFIAWAGSLWAVVTAAAAGLVALAPYIIIGGAIAAVAYVIYEAWTGNWWGIRDTIIEVIGTITTAFTAFIDLIKFMWETNMYGIRDIGMAVWNGLKLFLTTWWDAIKLMFKVATDLLFGNWKGAWEGVLQLTELVFTAIMAAGDLLWKGLGALFDAGIKALSGAWGSFMDGIKGIAMNIWEGIKEAFKGGLNWIIEKMNTVINAYSSVIAKVPGVGKKLVIPNIPYLAEGGIVTGPTLAMIGEAGPEAVIPLNKARGGVGVGGLTIVIEGNNFYGDDEEFAMRIGDTLMKLAQPHLNFQTA